MVNSGLGFTAAGLTAKDVLNWGANFNPYTLETESWRLMTSVFVHGGYIHLLLNMIALYFLGADLEKYIGRLEFLVLYLLCGIAGGIASLWWNIYSVSVGASGAIFGLYGFNLIISIIEEVKMQRSIIKLIINFIIFVSITIIFGEYMNVDHAGHFGGLFSGVFLAFYKEIRSYSSLKFPRVIDSTIFFGLIYILIFYLLPRSQVEYYKAFQELLAKEKIHNQLLRADYSSDAEYLDSLKSALPLWIDVQKNVLLLQDLPYELALDRLVLIDYCSLRRESLVQRVNSLEEESYIYWDSIEVVNESVGALPGLRYILNYEEIQPDTTQNLPKEENSLYPVKIFYDGDWKETEDLTIAEYFRIGQQDSLGRWQRQARDYYKDGSIQMKGYYKDGLKDGVFRYYQRDSVYDAAGVYDEEIKVGKWEYFHENGKKQRKIFYDDKTYTLQVWDTVGNLVVIDGNGTEITKYDNDIISLKGEYEEGLRTGVWYGYYEDGKPYFEEFYENGDLINGKSFNKQGLAKNYDYTVNLPKPKGGYTKLQQYLNAYEFVKSLDSDKSGKMTVIFQVDEKGKVSDFRFKDSPGPLYELEAIQLLRNGPQWIPAMQYGQVPYTSETLVKISYP